MIKKILKEWVKRHYDLHLVLGIGIGFITASFYAPMFIHIVLAPLLAFGGGFCLEAYQSMVLKAETDNNDYISTTLGGVLSLLVTIPLVLVDTPFWLLLSIGVVLILTAYLLRKSRT